MKSLSRRSCAVLLALVIVVALIGIVLPLTASADFDSPFVKYDNIVITYSTAAFDPSAYPVSAVDAVLKLSAVSDVDPFVLIQAYSFYKCSQGNYICAEMKSSTPFGYVFWRDSNGEYQYFIWKEGEGEESSSPVPDDVKDNDYQNATVTGKEFKDFCNTYGSTYCPKNTKDFISWRTRTFDENNSLYQVPLLIFRNSFFCGDAWLEGYLLPFYTDGNYTYYSIYQFHFYKDIIQHEDGTYTSTLYCDMWSLVDDTEPVTYTITEEFSKYSYVEFTLLPAYMRFTFYETQTEYVTRKYTTTKDLKFASNDLIGGVRPTYYFSTDLLIKLDWTEIAEPFQYTTTTHDASCDCNGGHNVGFYCSNKPIEKDLSSIDFTKFADDDTVILNGDTIYDYTITNKEGDSTTINNYITNNYTYPVTDTGDSGEEDSGTGTGVNGNVTVGGQVDVSGDIDVGGTFDINLNIQTESSSGTGAGQTGDYGDTSAYEYEQANVAEALGQIPEVSDGFIGFFTKVFDWLPPPIFGLIVGGLGLAIVLRIAGR